MGPLDNIKIFCATIVGPGVVVTPFVVLGRLSRPPLKKSSWGHPWGHQTLEFGIKVLARIRCSSLLTTNCDLSRPFDHKTAIVKPLSSYRHIVVVTSVPSSIDGGSRGTGQRPNKARLWQATRTMAHAVSSWLGWTPPEGSPCRETLERCFPDALPGDVVVRRSARLLNRFGFTPKNTLYGQSICPDEINNEKGDHTRIPADCACPPTSVGRTCMPMLHRRPRDTHVRALG